MKPAITIDLAMGVKISRKPFIQIMLGVSIQKDSFGIFGITQNLELRFADSS